MATPMKHRGTYLILISAGLAIGLVYAIFPVLWMLSCSLKSNTEIFSLPPRILPKVFTLEAYQAILGNSTKVGSS